MELDLEAQKQEFLEIARREIRREGLEELLGWLISSDFFTAPASTKYHGAYKGGLCQHALDVYRFAQKLAQLCESPLSGESLAVAALFHDLCKVNFYVTEYRNQKNADGTWEKVPTFGINEQFVYGGHGSKSVYIVQYFMKLKPEEAVAINCHMGFSEGGNNVQLTVGKAYEKYPLAWITHAADEAAAYLLER